MPGYRHVHKHPYLNEEETLGDYSFHSYKQRQGLTDIHHYLLLLVQVPFALSKSLSWSERALYCVSFSLLKTKMDWVIASLFAYLIFGVCVGGCVCSRARMPMCLCMCWDRFSLCRPSWPGTCIHHLFLAPNCWDMSYTITLGCSLYVSNRLGNCSFQWL